MKNAANREQGILELAEGGGEDLNSSWPEQMGEDADVAVWLLVLRMDLSAWLASEAGKGRQRSSCLAAVVLVAYMVEGAGWMDPSAAVDSGTRWRGHGVSPECCSGSGIGARWQAGVA
ncbi:hypothetical protein E2562_001315 [Oryza meyeriana var. granulata]|uniref:Uncharacterized protein n=1 Tax=Oryza meyeriana var. granulata TaxID=110450 RepID=A0A6G1DCH2_9ORYZ|nr:hypothetical protein E2562_001315 [Oryza meyeriana var. granulata]